jgi:hypothetical protein
MRLRPRLVGGIDEDGGCGEFLWGFLLGFIFSLFFVIVILMCRTKKMIKIGVVCGFISHVMLSYNNATVTHTNKNN